MGAPFWRGLLHSGIGGHVSGGGVGGLRSSDMVSDMAAVRDEEC